MSSETDEGYVHRPDEFDDASPGETDAGSRDERPADATAGDGATLPGAEPDGFGDRGWVLVATVVLAFLVIPGIIYVRPALPGAAGLSFLVAMLILPLVPAVLLGLVAVWSMSASRRR
ncbi:hypothetical protein [Salinigranum salinum]|uniref:hypothetical protein n=1 Tax=Salinigranum salinum TaxID=1364937 RepID=UPI00126088F4|nr:hypothetical protein [Salinigranum salinum]